MKNAGKMVLNEEQIVERCKTKDSKSQTLLYRQYAPFLYGIALRYTRTEEEAKDILQDAFIKVFDNIGQYKGIGVLKAWMTRIVINQALTVYQERSKRPVLENFDDYEEIITDNSVIESDVLSHEILLGFINDLPYGYKMIFNMCEIEGYSYDEVAKIMNCTYSTCRSQLSKAKNALRKKVNELNENENRYKK